MIKNSRVLCISNKFLFGIVCFSVIISFWTACTSQSSSSIESAFGPYQKPIINVDSALNKIESLLKEDSVDAVIILRYSCSGCNDQDPQLMGYKDGKQLKVQSAPLYVFWKKNGMDYVKKIDQFGYYATHRRDYLYDYQLYDFYARNKAELDTEKILQTNNDLSSQEKAYYRNIGVKLSADRYTYANGYPGVITYKRHDIEQSGATVKYWSATDQYYRKLDLFKFRPLVPADEKSIDLLYGNVPYGNNTEFYYHNQMLKINIWLKLIEGQLFEIESRSNWVVEKNLQL